MGALSCWAFDAAFVERFPIYIETGFGRGGSLRYAADAAPAFHRLYTIDIWEDAIMQASDDFANDVRVHCIRGDSAWALREFLPSISGPIFFFLDAHFPGEYHDQPRINPTFSLAQRMPLVHELRAIKDSKPDGNYTILIDDLRYFGRLPWQHFEIPTEARNAIPFTEGLWFLGPFAETHHVSIVLNDKGYALISPLGAPQPRYVRFEGS